MFIFILSAYISLISPLIGFSVITMHSVKSVCGYFDPEDPDSVPDHSQNQTISFFYLFRHIRKMSSKSVHKFLSYLVHKYTDKPRRKHNLLSRGNNINISYTFYQDLCG